MADAMCEGLASNAKKKANYKHMVTYGHLSLVWFGWEKQEKWINLQFSYHPTTDLFLLGCVRCSIFQ